MPRFAIYTDLSGVVEVDYGHHPTKLDALETLILHLESERSDIASKLAKAKAARRAETRRTS